jgi:hypothetical protein
MVVRRERPKKKERSTFAMSSESAHHSIDHDTYALKIS